MEESRIPFLVRVPAPLFFGITFVASAYLGDVFDWRSPWGQGAALHYIGWGLVCIALILAATSVGLFGLQRTTLNPAGRPARLVTAGAFSISRNPMYLGLTIAYVGLSFALTSPWSLAFIVVPLGLVNFLVIPFEEERMLATFGPTYVEYRRQVRRWI
ncbi:MAG: isoprenylcysteine carboxylmethyltransferase family protein [Caulobacteraceae bacterium]|nr:isoprenylcysteine carboxylmethyltransferase family protein [Caulobacteraceae bacterium]